MLTLAQEELLVAGRSLPVDKADIVAGNILAVLAKIGGRLAAGTGSLPGIRAGQAPAAVVLLSHNGMDVDLKLASEVSGIDAILAQQEQQFADRLEGLVR